MENEEDRLCDCDGCLTGENKKVGNLTMDYEKKSRLETEQEQ